MAMNFGLHLEVKAFGFLEINSQGVIGAFRLDASFPGLRKIGIETSGYANFMLNTTSQDKEITILFGPNDSETFTIPKETLAGERARERAGTQQVLV